MDKKLRVVLVKPGMRAIKIEIDGSLSGMQKVVDGYIQAIYPFEDPVALVCNEEGKLNGLPMNRTLSHQGEIYDVVCGDFFICLAPADSDEFESLTDELVDKYLEKFKTVEHFLRTKNGIIVIEEDTENA